VDRGGVQVAALVERREKALREAAEDCVVYDELKIAGAVSGFRHVCMMQGRTGAYHRTSVQDDCGDLAFGKAGANCGFRLDEVGDLPDLATMLYVGECQVEIDGNFPFVARGGDDIIIPRGKLKTATGLAAMLQLHGFHEVQIRRTCTEIVRITVQMQTPNLN
jgi:hypothetical protein